MTKLLPYLLTLVTQRARYKVVSGVDFQWSKTSLTYNLFRAYELIFWRRSGIRAGEATYATETGKEVKLYFTYESLVVHVEQYIRAYFKLPRIKLVKVPVPQYAFAGAPVQRAKFQYAFAIAFDAVTPGTQSLGLTLTINHTVTGSNPVLTACTASDGPTGANPTGVVYNTSETMTSADGIIDSNKSSSLWYLSSPTTGSSLAMVITYGLTQRFTGAAVSFSGAAASPLGVTGTTSGSSAAISKSVTTTAANSMLIDSAYNNNSAGTQSADGSQTKRVEQGNADGFDGLASTLLTTTTGSYTMSWTLAQSATWNTTVVELKPFVASSGNSNFLIFM